MCLKGRNLGSSTFSENLDFIFGNHLYVYKKDKVCPENGLLFGLGSKLGDHVISLSTVCPILCH